MDTEKKKDTKGKGSGMKLPASGLAEEVLGTLDRREESPGTVPAGPDRLFAFADSLKRQEGEEDRDQKAEEELETWVTFILSGECYGLPVSHVQEILRVAGITRVPHAPHPVRGVTNLRGRVLPVVDLRVRLDMAEKAIDGTSRILVVSSQGRQMGLLVDAVHQVVRIARSGIQPPPPDIMTAQSDYIQGVYNLQDSLIIMLAVDRVLLIQDSLQHGPNTRD